MRHVLSCAVAQQRKTKKILPLTGIMMTFTEHGQVRGNTLSTGFSTESPGAKLNTKPCSKCCRTIKHNYKLIGGERRQESDPIGKRSRCSSLESSRLVS